MSAPLTGIARLARQGPLLEAKSRVQYSELPTGRYLNRCSRARMPFTWTLNPYRGCEFNCRYCYARYTHDFLEYREPDAFETRIFAKHFDEAAFRAELRRLPRESIALGTATDPYQPAERRFHITRRMLQVFAGVRNYRLGIITKGDLIRRDAPLLAEVARHNRLSVGITITTLDPQLARLLEPQAPRPDLRLRAVTALAKYGIPVGVYASPALPGINDSDEQLRAVAQAARDHGAQAFGARPLFLQPCAQKTLFPLLDEHFPRLAKHYRAQFRTNPYQPRAAEEALSQRTRAIREQLGLQSSPLAWAPESEVQLTLFSFSPPGTPAPGILPAAALRESSPYSRPAAHGSSAT